MGKTKIVRRHRNFWNEEKYEIVREMFLAKKSDKEIGDVIGATERAVEQRRYKLGLRKGNQPSQLQGKHRSGPLFPNEGKPYTRDEIVHMQTFLGEAGSASKRTAKWGMKMAKRLAKAFGRRVKSVYGKMSRDGWLKKDKEVIVKKQPKISFPEVPSQVEALKANSFLVNIVCSPENYETALSKIDSLKDLNCPVNVKIV